MLQCVLHIYIYIYVCVCVCFPGHGACYCSWKTLDGEVYCLQRRTGIIKVKWRVLLQNTLGENLFRTFRNVLTLSVDRNKCDSNRHWMFDWAFTTQLYRAALWMFMFKYAAARVVYWEGIFEVAFNMVCVSQRHGEEKGTWKVDSTTTNWTNRGVFLYSCQLADL